MVEPDYVDQVVYYQHNYQNTTKMYYQEGGNEVDKDTHSCT